MSYRESDESWDWNEDIDAFEHQLRAVRPTAPVQTWDSISERIESSYSQTMPASSSTVRSSAPSSAWRSVVSHSLTAAIGLAVGSGLMLNRPDSKLSGTETRVGEASITRLESEIKQPSTQIRPADSGYETKFTASTTGMGSQFWQQPIHRGWPLHRSLHDNLRGQTLTAFGSIHTRFGIDDDWRKKTDRSEILQPGSSGGDATIEYPNRDPVDRPVLSPRSLHLFFDDLTYAPESDQPNRNAEVSRS